MKHLEQLDPETRAWAMVGRFMQMWSLVEANLNHVVGKVLSLEGVKTYLVTSNLQFRDKIHIVSTAISMAALAAERRSHWTKRVNAINTFCQTHRNMVAHQMFSSSDDKKGVVFWSVKAKGKLTFPETPWTLDDLDEHCETMNGFMGELATLRDELSSINFLAQVLMNAPMPSNEPLGPAGHPARLPQGTQDSTHPASTTETDPQTPQTETE